MAVQAGFVDAGRDVIAVGGYGSGADTAVIAKSSFPEALFSPKTDERLEIREILAMPRRKKWWKWDTRSCLGEK
ncbi:TPA: hypothetical protein EYP44_00150 [Candidatus Bathyarchaeota archaeon]|nr:hypothetical protein [Candidatus Bathyarchaeota archaeon]